MDSLRRGSITISRHHLRRQQCSNTSLGISSYMNSFSSSSCLKFTPFSLRTATRMMVADVEDLELKQARDMNAARKRCDAMVRKGKLKVTPREAGYATLRERSLAACVLLHNVRYRNLFWVQGGLETAEEEDLISEGPPAFKIRWNWWGVGIFGVGIFLVADAMFVGAQQVSRYPQDIRSH